MTKEQFVELLRPLAQALQGFDVDAKDAAVLCAAKLPFASPAVAAVQRAAIANIASDWMLPKSNAGIRFGRVVKDLLGFSVDAVLMDVPGPKHRHPNGEIDLCMATKGAPKFDGHDAGWVVYGKGSVHVPTVRGGEMLILYFLPAGAIEFLTA
ncbi:MAG: DUF4863 family protein [Planctomycetes bacterium]|nr:DUF4863 family protein [Planctomycetota bacterium]